MLYLKFEDMKVSIRKFDVVEVLKNFYNPKVKRFDDMHRLQINCIPTCLSVFFLSTGASSRMLPHQDKALKLGVN